MEGVIDIDRILGKSADFPRVVHTEEIGYGCFPEGLEKIRQSITKHNLNRVVVAACSHRTHEALFQKTVREAGLNSFLMEMVNLRGFSAWVHPHQPEQATRKGLELIRVGVGRAATLEPIYKSSIPPHRRALVIGGGVSGMTAALSIADSGFDVVLIEREQSLGGNLQKVQYLVEGENPHSLLRDLINRLIAHEHVTVMTKTVLQEHNGHVGAYHAVLKHKDGSRSEISHGVTIVATDGRTPGGTHPAGIRK
jgi:heterodisulfide reductase subunit A